MRILIIEKKQESTERWIKELEKNNSYTIDTAHNMKDGDYHINVRSYDLVLVGYELDDGGAIDVLTILKEKYPKVPVIVLGDREAEHEIAAFQSGADDYVSYPINPQVLLARIQARLKLSDSSVIEIEDMLILPNEEKVVYKGEMLDVKGKPFEVLTHLARQKGQIVSKDQLLNAIWEEPELVTPNVIEVAINQIRQKMDKPLGISTIETVRRRGYRFCYPNN